MEQPGFGSWGVFVGEDVPDSGDHAHATAIGFGSQFSGMVAVNLFDEFGQQLVADADGFQEGEGEMDVKVSYSTARSNFE